MISEIVNSTFTDYNIERKSEICSFLREQEINEKNIDTISSCLFVIQKLYDEIPKLKLIFDKKINISIIKKQVELSREGIAELNIYGIDAIEESKNIALRQMIEYLKELLIFKDNFIVTNGNFLSFSIIDEDSYQPKILISMNCKVLNLKEIRKLKLNNINQSKNCQFLH